ncbi:MAG: hypothetical protein ACYC7D_00145 [Nitrososphaerales archaeon]
MNEELRESLQANEMRCVRCGLVIPYVFERGNEYTCPSFTIVDNSKVCYYCYHPGDYEAARKSGKSNPR